MKRDMTKTNETNDELSRDMHVDELYKRVFASRDTITIAQFARALKIDAKRARAKLRKQNVWANNETKRHDVLSKHDKNDFVTRASIIVA